jgi:anthraniloyl-CoA monooxygenase
MGDALHTAHFSIGSGTKLAMEDAISLSQLLERHRYGDIPAVLAAYQAEREGEVLRLQRAAQTSLEWFESSARYQAQDPTLFTFNLMTRSKRITYDNLAVRDPALVRDVAAEFARESGENTAADAPPPPMFTPFTLRGLTVPNRIVVSPMCQYSATDGVPNDWHLVHLGSRAVGGAGLVMTEMTDVTPDGRITLGCAGMWADEHEAAWRRVVDFVHRQSRAKIGVQLAHAGRKGSCHVPWERAGQPLGRGEGAWQTIAPSALPFDERWHVPREMTRADMDEIVAAFVAATHRSARAGFDLIELHMAHGYLLSSFLSPLSNHRVDAYGGTLENRARFPLEVFARVREAWPRDKPLSVRISASDWVPSGGVTIDEAVTVARMLRERGCDIVDVSSGGNSPASKIVYGRMYQVPFSDQIRHEARVATIAVGGIQDADHANTVIAAGRADLCALARPHLVDPYLTTHAATRYGYEPHPWPSQYLPARPPPSKR